MSNQQKPFISESTEFLAALEQIFSTSPYNVDSRKEMMHSHILNGRTSSAKRIQKILPYLTKPIAQVQVLDTGCGSGMASAAFADLGFRKIVGFDLGGDPLGLPLAPLRYYPPQAGVDFIKANGFQIPIADNTIDLSWCSFVVEHIDQPEKLFKEIYRILAPSGIFYISTNNRLWPIEPHSGTLLASWLPTKWAEKYARWRRHWPDHVPWDVYLPTYWQLNRWALNAGFEIVASTYELVGAKPDKTLQKFPLLQKFEFLFPNLYLILKKSSPPLPLNGSTMV